MCFSEMSISWQTHSTFQSSALFGVYIMFFKDVFQVFFSHLEGSTGGGVRLFFAPKPHEEVA